MLSSPEPAFNISYKSFTITVLHYADIYKLFFKQQHQEHWISNQQNLNTPPEQLRVKLSQQLQARLK